jgi:hypothetical protein
MVIVVVNTVWKAQGEFTLNISLGGSTLHLNKEGKGLLS